MAWQGSGRVSCTEVPHSSVRTCIQVAYCLWGLISSQLGDVHDEQLVTVSGQTLSVAAFIHLYFGQVEQALYAQLNAFTLTPDICVNYCCRFWHGFIGVATAVLIGFIVLFRAVTTIAMQLLVYQTR